MRFDNAVDVDLGSIIVRPFVEDGMLKVDGWGCLTGIGGGIAQVTGVDGLEVGVNIGWIIELIVGIIGLMLWRIEEAVGVGNLVICKKEEEKNVLVICGH